MLHELEFRVKFSGGTKTGSENQQQTESIYGTGNEPGPKASALNTAGHPCSRQTSRNERVIHISEGLKNIEQSMKESSNFEVLSGLIFFVKALFLSSRNKTRT